MLVEGDIVVPVDFYETLAARGTYAPNLWPSGTVPYQFDGGVTGSQAVMDFLYPGEIVPPTPDPMTFAIVPNATTSGIAMRASLATDDTPPIKYQFVCDSGGVGCVNSTWRGQRDYEATGLDPDTEYTYRTRARDGIGPPNETALSDPESAYTFAAIPGAPTLSNETAGGMDIAIDPNGNPAYTEFVIYCFSSPDSNWEFMFMDASGNPAFGLTWQTVADWGSGTATGMQPDTEYCFQLGAKNQTGRQTAGGPVVCSTTTLVANAAIVSTGSCRTHGLAGEFCLDVTEGAPGDNVEPRLGGIQKLQLLMDDNVSNFTASVSCTPTGYTGTVTPTANGSSTVTVTFVPGLADKDCCEVTLAGADADDSTFVANLTGDVNLDQGISSADAASVKQRLGQVTTGSNFQYDVNVDGSISSADYASIKQRLGNVVPACP